VLLQAARKGATKYQQNPTQLAECRCFPPPAIAHRLPVRYLQTGATTEPTHTEEGERRGDYDHVPARHSNTRPCPPRSILSRSPDPSADGYGSEAAGATRKWSCNGSYLGPREVTKILKYAMGNNPKHRGRCDSSLSMKSHLEGLIAETERWFVLELALL
jgi:hypothetical protein